MQLFTLDKTTQIKAGTLIGLGGDSLNTRLPDLVEPYTSYHLDPDADDIDGRLEFDEKLNPLDHPEAYLLVTPKFDLHFKAGETLLLDPKQAKSLGLQPLEAQPEPPTEPPASPPAPPAPSSEGVKSEAPAVVDPLIKEDTAPTPLGDGAFDPLGDSDPTDEVKDPITVGELLAQNPSLPSEAEGEGVNNDGD
jgi:hypothetical protein